MEVPGVQTGSPRGAELTLGAFPHIIAKCSTDTCPAVESACSALRVLAVEAGAVSHGAVFTDTDPKPNRPTSEGRDVDLTEVR